MASDPASPEICPEKASELSSLSVPVVPVNVTDCALAPSISTVSPSPTVRDDVAFVKEVDAAVSTVTGKAAEPTLALLARSAAPTAKCVAKHKSLSSTLTTLFAIDASFNVKELSSAVSSPRTLPRCDNDLITGLTGKR